MLCGTMLWLGEPPRYNTRMDEKPKRRAPYVTLRDLFAVVTIAAVLLAWWLDHRQLKRHIGEMKKKSPSAAYYQELKRQGYVLPPPADVLPPSADSTGRP